MTELHASTSSSNSPACFRLLLHGQNGSIPYLTPQLIRLIFCPLNNDYHGRENRITDMCSDVVSSLNPTHPDNHWKWYRDHLILGVAVNDTCVSPIYNNPTSSSQKRTMSESQSNRHNKLVKLGAYPTGASVSEPQQLDVSTSSASTYKIEIASGKKDNDRKPNGYTFLNPDQTRVICNRINSFIHTSDTDGSKTNVKTAGNSKKNKVIKDLSSSYMSKYLRIPNYVSTMIVPAFSFVDCHSLLSAGWDKCGGVDADHHDEKNINVRKKKGYTSKKQIQPKEELHKKQQQPKNVTPRSTRNAVAIDTPHGWQFITPEQYSNAVLSLIEPFSSELTHLTNPEALGVINNLGVIGLFDYLDISNDQFDALFSCGDSSDNGRRSLKSENNHEENNVAELRDQVLKKLTASAQKSTCWSIRSENILNSQAFNTAQVPLWYPVHILTSHLTKKMLPIQNCQPSLTYQRHSNFLKSSHIAIVAWETLFSSPTLNRQHRRKILRNLIEEIKCASTSTSQNSPKEFLLLAVYDLKSILDSAREGVSIIGTNLAADMSRKGLALALDLSWVKEDDTVQKNESIRKEEQFSTNGKIDLKEMKYANDSQSILKGCCCLTCRPRETLRRNSHYQHFDKNYANTSRNRSRSPSFSRAYIHHLIHAKEMVAETLLFIHNLHQLILLFQQLSHCASLDNVNVDQNASGKDEKSNLEKFCQKLERQI